MCSSGNCHFNNDPTRFIVQVSSWLFTGPYLAESGGVDQVGMSSYRWGKCRSAGACAATRTATRYYSRCSHIYALPLAASSHSVAASLTQSAAAFSTTACLYFISIYSTDTVLSKQCPSLCWASQSVTSYHDNHSKHSSMAACDRGEGPMWQGSQLCIVMSLLIIKTP